MIKYEDSIRKPFSDLSKLVIGIIVSLIPFVNLIAKGFILETSGLGKTKASTKMPEWKDWASLFFKGLISIVISIVYALPAVAVLTATAGLAAMSLAGTFIGSIIPSEMVSSVVAGEASPSVIGQLISQNWYLVLPTVITLAPMIIVGLVLLLLAVYVTPVAVLNYLKNNKFGKAFDLKYVFRCAFTAKYFIVWLVAGIITMVASAILSLIPLVGSQIAFFVSGVIAYSLYGDVLREIKNKK